VQEALNLLKSLSLLTRSSKSMKNSNFP